MSVAGESDYSEEWSNDQSVPWAENSKRHPDNPPYTLCIHAYTISGLKADSQKFQCVFCMILPFRITTGKKKKHILDIYIYNIRYIYLGLPWGVGFNMWDFPPTCNSHQNHHHHPPTAPRIVYLFPYESTRDQGIPHDLQIMHELWAVERYQAVLVGVCWVPNSLRVWKPKNPKGGPKIGMFSRNEIFFRWWDEKWIDFAIWDVFLRCFLDSEPYHLTFIWPFLEVGAWWKLMEIWLPAFGYPLYWRGNERIGNHRADSWFSMGNSMSPTIPKNILVDSVVVLWLVAFVGVEAKCRM